MRPEEYNRLAREAILGLLDQEHAAVWLEIEAKLADRPHPQVRHGLNPHHLVNAKNELLRGKLIEQIPRVTKGGGTVSVFALTNRYRRKTAFERAAERKSLLQARYLGWTIASAHGPNMIGDAGERVVHASLSTAAGHGYLLLKQGRRDVAQLFGQPVPGGSLDDAANLVVYDDQYPVPITVLIEVKNIRHWIYPDSAEIYQLLDKAARLQQAHPNQLFVPVLVCRKVHYLTFRLAKSLGFIIFYFGNNIQPILPHSEVIPAHLQEVVEELDYQLIQTDGPLDSLSTQFNDTLPKDALAISKRWEIAGASLGGHYRLLRDPSLLPQRRRSSMEQLKREMQALPGMATDLKIADDTGEGGQESTE